MEKDKMMRIVISDAVRKGIRNIKTDPHRSIRNLVDLGNHFSTGRFQQTFFENTQQLLMDPQSPYYDLIYRTVSNVDDDTLTRIGVNVGYMSWTFGAAKIRRIAQSDGYVVPWTLLIDMKGACSAPLDIERMIKEGQHQGIYTYMFFLSDDIDETAALLKIFARYPESAFIVFSDFDAVSDFLAHDTFTLKNIVISIGLNQSGRPDYTGCLIDKKRFFGIHAYYDDADIPAILSGEYMEHMTETGAALANFIAKKTCSPCADGQIADYIAKIRVGQCYPIFPVALFQDAAYVGRIILSEFSHMISIAKNGKTAVGNETLDIDARSVSLQQLLISAMRKNNGLRGVS